MTMRNWMLVSLLLPACGGADAGAILGGDEAPVEDSAPASTEARDRCAGGGALDFLVSGRHLDRLEGRRVAAAAFENEPGPRVSGARVVLRSGTIRGGAFRLSCSRSLHETYAYPSFAAYVDVDGNGRCNAGDLGFQGQRYGWNQHVQQSIQPADWQDVARLGPPLGAGARDFCGGYFR